MGKKIKRSKKISKGINKSITESTIKAVKNAVSYVDIMNTKAIAWKKGKNPWVTVANPRGEKNKPFVRIRAEDYWGSPKSTFNMYGGKSAE